MLFESPDFSPFQNLTSDPDAMLAIQGFSGHAENLQARVANLMQSETAFVQEFASVGRSAHEGSLTTSFADDNSFAPMSKDHRVSSEDDGPPVVVTGKRLSNDFWDDGSSSANDGINWSETSEVGTGGTGQPIPDEAIIDIQILIDRPLTASEEAALEDLMKTIAAIEKAIMELADNAVLTLANGATVTGAELKAIWATTDFAITDNVNYGNGGPGAAVMSYGQATIFFNIQGLDGYDHLGGGTNYLVAHELGHLTQAGTSLYTDQRTANDIARAILNGADLPYYRTPDFGYSPDAPTKFSVPSAEGGGGGGPGGGGGGCGGDGSGEENCW